MGVTPRMIELDIDDLVLDGVDPSSPTAVGEALQAHLVRLFNEQPPTFAGNASLDTVMAPPLPTVPPSDARGLGAAIATSVHGEFAR